MTLRIKPVMLKQSVYLRVPNDIADLIDIQPNAEVILTLEERDGKYFLIYSVGKSPILREARRPEQLVALQTAQQAMGTEGQS